MRKMYSLVSAIAALLAAITSVPSDVPAQAPAPSATPNASANVHLPADSSNRAVTRIASGADPSNTVGTPATVPVKGANGRSVVLTVEGGGTLGAYEGGLTWALTEIFRRRRLLDAEPFVPDSSSVQAEADEVIKGFQRFEFRAAAGASAGSINAFLAANRWCATGAQQRAADSPFWRAWVVTALSDMMPADNEPGVLSRRSYSGIFGDIERNLVASSYDSTCKVMFGAAMTRLTRDSLPISLPRELFARNQRYAAAFSVNAPKQLGLLPNYTSFSRDSTPIRLGTLVQLVAAAPADTIAHEHAYDLLKASSGFPFAFEPYQVSYCRKPLKRISDSATGIGCPTGLKRETAYFVDGGVFDNGPLTIGYGLALADPTRISLDSLAMLFVTPNRRRGLSAVSGDSADARSDGLDAVVRLLKSFVPSARQYELQIAARFLPAIQEGLSKDDKHEALIRDLRAAGSLQDLRAAKQYDTLTKYWREARTDIWFLETMNDQLRTALGQCAADPTFCVNVTDDSLWAQTQRRLDRRWNSNPPAAVQAEAIASAAVMSRTPFDSLLFVTSRWHNLAGDWLFGFGGFVGRPFREYDFYVGVYDALSLIAERVKCNRITQPFCVRDSLRVLIRKPPLLLDDTERRVLGLLFTKEYGENDAPTFQSPATAPARELMLATIVEAMSHHELPNNKRCKNGGPLERLICGQGMDGVLQRLRDNPTFKTALATSRELCSSNPTRRPCEIDDDFVKFVKSPAVALNGLVGDMLNRIWHTTPDTSGFKAPLTLANAIYFSTNERSRSGFDFGSVSVPTRRSNATTGLWILPSSLGGFAGMRGWYAEWAARWHLSPNFAAGPTARVVWSSRVRTPPPADYGNHLVPSLRLERKIGGSAAPLVSTLGVDLAYWSDYGAWHGRGRLSPGLTAALLAQKVRVLWALRPRPTKRTQAFFSIGLGDIPGLFYWIGEVTNQGNQTERN